MIYKCSVCGYVFDEEKEGRSISDLTECPVCRQPADRFVPVDGGISSEESLAPESGDGVRSQETLDLEYPRETRKLDSDYRYMKQIHEMAVTGQPIIEAMGTKMKMPDWDDILILGAQLNPPPLDEHAPVSTMTVIGKKRKEADDSGKSGLHFTYVFRSAFQRDENRHG